MINSWVFKLQLWLQSPTVAFPSISAQTQTCSAVCRVTSVMTYARWCSHMTTWVKVDHSFETKHSGVKKCLTWLDLTWLDRWCSHMTTWVKVDHNLETKHSGVKKCLTWHDLTGDVVTWPCEWKWTTALRLSTMEWRSAWLDLTWLDLTGDVVTWPREWKWTTALRLSTVEWRSAWLDLAWLDVTW